MFEIFKLAQYNKDYDIFRLFVRKESFLDLIVGHDQDSESNLRELSSPAKYLTMIYKKIIQKIT